MPGELLRDMGSGRRMSREIEKRRPALLEAGIDIGLAEKALIARLMRVGEEHEGPRRAEAALAARRPSSR